jgi:uncharacterized protein
MLIEFSVANYLSFKDRVTFSMVAAPIKSEDKQLDASNVFVARSKLNLVTSAAVYGANASGKSNLISAMQSMRLFVLAKKPETRRTGGIDVEPFRLSTDTIDKPSEFEIVFMAEGRQYRYGFRADRERVHAEWLYHVPTSREALVFERTGDEVTLSSAFREGKGLATKTRPNALFLSVVAEFNGKTAQRITDWFGDVFHVISGLDDTGLIPFTMECLSDTEYCEAVTELIRRLDVGISTVELKTSEVDVSTLPDGLAEQIRATIEKMPKQTRERESADALKVRVTNVHTGHNQFDAQGLPAGRELFDLNDESEGTQKLFALAGPLVDTLRNGKIIVADEFDARLHPVLTRELIKLFNSTETNPHHAQLVIATHDTNLLDHRLLRRDQIWFTEKNRYGATDLYSLAEYRMGVRNDASFEKDYVRGRYGAIPYLGDLAGLLGGADAQAS